MTIFCQTKRIFVGRSSATVKKICEGWRKMGLFGPDSVPPNQLHYLIVNFLYANNSQMYGIKIHPIWGHVIIFITQLHLAQFCLFLLSMA